MSDCAKPALDIFALAEEKGVPLSMMLELTYRCNERCLHCYLPETQGTRAIRIKDELSAEQWCGVLEQLAQAGTLYLTLSGGEALLKEDFDKILRRARELTFSVEIFTNAVLITPEIADFWAEWGVFGVSVSVYYPEALWHDRVTKVEGSFDATIRGIRLLRERGISVTLKCPLMRFNLKTYRGLISLAQSMGCGYTFDPMITLRNDGSDEPTRLGLDDKRFEEAYREDGLIPVDEVLRAGNLDLDSPTCSAGRTSGAIGPYGDVVPCIQWVVPGGNVRERSFAEIWKEGGIFRQARELTGKDVKPCPECGRTHLAHCSGLSQLEHGNPLVPDSSACRMTRMIQQIQEQAKETA